MGRKARTDYPAMPPEYEDVLWRCIKLEVLQAVNAGLIPRHREEDLKHEIYLHIRTHWRFDASRGFKPQTYCSFAAKKRIASERERFAKEDNFLKFYGEGEEARNIENSAGAGTNPFAHGYTIDDVLELGGFTEEEKEIMRLKLEGETNRTIATKIGKKVGQVLQILSGIKGHLQKMRDAGGLLA